MAKILLRSFSNRRKLSELKEDWLRSTNERRARERQTKGENGDPTRVPRVILEGNYFFSNFLLRHRTLSALAGLIDTWRAVQHVFPTRLIKFNVIRQRGGDREREREKDRTSYREVGKPVFAELKRNSIRRFVWNSINRLLIRRNS